MRAAILLGFAFVLGCSSEKKEEEPALPACPTDTTTAPNELRCTGLYADWTKKTLAAEAIAYKPGLELWSDGAEKTRYFSMPKGAKIDTTDPDEWVFPVGTKTWKEFRINGKKIETRLYWKISNDQWAWTTYRWLPDESRADRLDTGRAQVEGKYEIPTVQQCDTCHRGRKDRLLGIEAIALAHPDATGLTLARMKQEGMLSTDVPTPAIPDDATGKAKAALSYMHMNCGVSCHDSAGHSPASKSGLHLKLKIADLAAGKPVAELPTFKTSVNVEIDGNAYFEYKNKGFVRIKPGASNTSLVPTLAGLRDVSIQMPPTGTHEVDTTGLAAIESWINALPAQ